VLVGAAVSLLALVWLFVAILRRGHAPVQVPDCWRMLALWTVTLFPPVYIALSGATIYDGIRHLLFTYPPLVVLSACGWRFLLGSPGRPLRALASVALALGLLEPLLFQWRNHPNQAVYFSAPAGGPRGAFGRYELDYWGNSVLQALQWADQMVRPSGIRVAVSGLPPHIVRDDVRRFAVLDFAWPEFASHHLEILFLRGLRREVLEMAGRADILHAVTTADGTPLAIVVPGPRFAEVAGSLHLPVSPPPAR
jgi:hypothetical protein